MTMERDDELPLWVSPRDEAREQQPVTRPLRARPRPGSTMLPPSSDAAADDLPKIPRQPPPPALRPTAVAPPEPARQGFSRVVGRVAQIMDFAFFVLYAFLGLRLALSLIGARPGADFVRFVHAATQPFYAPFEGIVASPAVGAFRLDLSVVIAIVAYALLHGALERLLRALVTRRVTV